MSAIVKQSVPTPQAKTVSAADLLAGAAKKDKSSNHLVYVGGVGSEAATRCLDLNDEVAEIERELDLARDRVLDVIRPWHEDACAKRKAHEATVVVETPNGALRVSTRRCRDPSSRVTTRVASHFERDERQGGAGHVGRGCADAAQR